MIDTTRIVVRDADVRRSGLGRGFACALVCTCFPYVDRRRGDCLRCVPRTAELGVGISSSTAGFAFAIWRFGGLKTGEGLVL